MGLVLRVDDLKKNQRQTVSGALIVEPDWFLREAAGVKRPECPGLTMAEYRTRKARRRRAIKQAAVVLAAVALIVAVFVL